MEDWTNSCQLGIENEMASVEEKWRVTESWQWLIVLTTKIEFLQVYTAAETLELEMINENVSLNNRHFPWSWRVALNVTWSYYYNLIPSPARLHTTSVVVESISHIIFIHFKWNFTFTHSVSIQFQLDISRTIFIVVANYPVPGSSSCHSRPTCEDWTQPEYQ